MSGLTKIALDRTYALNFPTLQQAGKIGGLTVVAGDRGCMSAANPFHIYFLIIIYSRLSLRMRMPENGKGSKKIQSLSLWPRRWYAKCTLFLKRVSTTPENLICLCSGSSGENTNLNVPALPDVMTRCGAKGQNIIYRKNWLTSALTMGRAHANTFIPLRTSSKRCAK